MRRRVEQLMRAGRHSDAAGALLAERSAKLTAGNVAILRDKFPFDESPLDSMVFVAESLKRIKVETSTVESCVQRWKSSRKKPKRRPPRHAKAQWCCTGPGRAAAAQCTADMGGESHGGAEFLILS